MSNQIAVMAQRLSISETDLDNIIKKTIMPDSKKVTNTVQVYTLDDLFDQAGHFIFRQALEKWAECLETGVWGTYRQGVTQLDCPSWWAKKILAYED